MMQRSIVLTVEIVKFERRRMVKFRTRSPGRQPLQEGIVDRKIRVVLVQEPNSGSLNGELFSLNERDERLFLDYY